MTTAITRNCEKNATPLTTGTTLSPVLPLKKQVEPMVGAILHTDAVFLIIPIANRQKCTVLPHLLWLNLKLLLVIILMVLFRHLISKAFVLFINICLPIVCFFLQCISHLFRLISLLVRLTLVVLMPFQFRTCLPKFRDKPRSLNRERC